MDTPSPEDREAARALIALAQDEKAAEILDFIERAYSENRLGPLDGNYYRQFNGSEFSQQQICYVDGDWRTRAKEEEFSPDEYYEELLEQGIDEDRLTLLCDEDERPTLQELMLYCKAVEERDENDEDIVRQLWINLYHVALPERYREDRTVYLVWHGDPLNDYHDNATGPWRDIGEVIVHLDKNFTSYFAGYSFDLVNNSATPSTILQSDLDQLAHWLDAKAVANNHRFDAWLKTQL